MLAAELALFVWMNERIAGVDARRDRRGCSRLMVASDVAAAIADDPELDLEAHVRGQFGSVLQTFIVVMRDGRVATNHEAYPASCSRPPASERLEARPFGRGRGARTPRRSAASRSRS